MDIYIYGLYRSIDLPDLGHTSYILHTPVRPTKHRSDRPTRFLRRRAPLHGSRGGRDLWRAALPWRGWSVFWLVETQVLRVKKIELVHHGLTTVPCSEPETLHGWLGKKQIKLPRSKGSGQSWERKHTRLCMRRTKALFLVSRKHLEHRTGVMKPHRASLGKKRKPV